jgi:hypothetical protein
MFCNCPVIYKGEVVLTLLIYVFFYSGSTYQDNLEPDQLNAALGTIAQNRTQAVVSAKVPQSMFFIMVQWYSRNKGLYCFRWVAYFEHSSFVCVIVMMW